MSRKSFTAEEARRIGEQIGIDWPAHLNEFPDYYVRLEKMEAEARRGRDPA